ncbi:hypothetical protein TNCT_309471 [Trichonephila clavata]|uniref:Uncharacterized protein n=1 Tax=Trichonephila clavata TaxID=2740835 RepID=A0A8X6JPA3_TRICU|nr:hypothetical protein TNCT_309471 [Trichonephila clavata]
MMSFFFYPKCPLPVDFLERGTTSTAQRYQTTLRNLRRTINSKRPDMLSNDVVLLQSHPWTIRRRGHCSSFSGKRWTAPPPSNVQSRLFTE